MTFKEKYTKLSKKLIKADTSKFNEDFAIQVTLSDEDCGGTFFVAYTDGAYRVEAYDYVDNTAVVDVKADVFEKLIDKKLTAEAALYEGTMSVKGNVNHVVMLADAFEKKTPAKKPATKKAPAKKAVAKKTEEKKPAEKKAEIVVEKATPAVVDEKKIVEKKAEVKKAEEKKPVEKKAEAKKAEKKPVAKKTTK